MKQLRIDYSITNRADGVLDKYLSDVAKENMIQPEDEVLLAQQIKMGDRNALDRLVRANLRFVVSVAKQYQNQGISLADLISEGNIGLMKAAVRFDETRGMKFISYAVWWIRQSILQALASQTRTVRLPQNKIGELVRVKKTASVLEQLYQRKPTTQEIADELDMSVERVNDLLCLNREVSLDEPVSDEDDNTLIDMLSPSDVQSADETVNRKYESQLIAQSMDILDEKERLVINMYFGLGSENTCTLEEIGSMLDMTRERVRQVKDKALKKLRMKSCTSLHQMYDAR